MGNDVFRIDGVVVCVRCSLTSSWEAKIYARFVMAERNVLRNDVHVVYYDVLGTEYRRYRLYSPAEKKYKYKYLFDHG